MKETEITVQVFDSFENIDKILTNQGFKMVENFILNDWYVSHLQNVDDVDYQQLLNNSILVRQVAGDRSYNQLIYKKKDLDSFGNVISEEKTEVKLSDLDNTLKIFNLAGFNNYIFVKNNSYVYQKDDVVFVVQVVDDLGIFIEYEEDESMKNMTEMKKVKRLTQVIQKLGLKLGDDFSCKKVYMLLKK